MFVKTKQNPPEVQVSHCPLLDLSSVHMNEVSNPQALMDMLKCDSPVPSPSQLRKPGLRFSNRRIRRQPRKGKGQRAKGVKGLGVDVGEELHSGELYSLPSSNSPNLMSCSSSSAYYVPGTSFLNPSNDFQTGLSGSCLFPQFCLFSRPGKMVFLLEAFPDCS